MTTINTNDDYTYNDNINYNDYRGIYVEMIYNPRYYNELSILKFMLQEILNRNPQINFFYDYNQESDSTKITIGEEYTILQFNERDLITINPKMLKDILYNENIFTRIYDLLLSYFRANVLDSTSVPEYDRLINFNRYRKMFNDRLVTMDRTLETVCRSDELTTMYQNRICIVADYDKINEVNFTHQNTVHYWTELMTRTAYFMQKLLDHLLHTNGGGSPPCYTIKIYPQSDVRRVLLLPHDAVKTVERDENVTFSLEYKNRIEQDLILFKHRILHSLGMGHKYTETSVMNWYNMPFQKMNLFSLFADDVHMLEKCYPIVGRFINSRIIRSGEMGALNFIDVFINDFERFKFLYNRMF